MDKVEAILQQCSREWACTTQEGADHMVFRLEECQDCLAIDLFVLRSVECNCLHTASGVHLGYAECPFYIGFDVNFATL